MIQYRHRLLIYRKELIPSLKESLTPVTLNLSHNAERTNRTDLNVSVKKISNVDFTIEEADGKKNK